MYTATNTRIIVAEFDYRRPQTLADVHALLAEHDGTARLVAGGTDLIVQMKMERVSPTFLISLAEVSDLEGITSGDGCSIGSMTSIETVSQSGPVCTKYTALAEACQAFSTVPIMIMGTIGGNLCNASPAADTAPALLVFDASLDLVTSDGGRQVPLHEFFTGPGKTLLGTGEVLKSVRLPEPGPGTGSAFLKVSRVVADISQACAAVMLVRDGKKITDCRIALGSVAPTPVRAAGAEKHLIGRNGDPDAFEKTAQIAAREISPITDVRATKDYRRHVAAIIVRDALTTAWQRAGEA